MWNPFRKKSVAIVGHYASYAGAGEILAEFRRRPQWDSRLIVDRRDEHQGFWREYDVVYWPELDPAARRRLTRFVERATLTIVAGTPSLDLWTRVLLGSPHPRTSYRRDELLAVLPQFAEHCRGHRTALLVSDSVYLDDVEQWNARFDELRGLHLFAMPDKIPFVQTAQPVTPFWAVVDCSGITPRDRGDEIRVGHSPSKGARRLVKGSELIEQVCARNGIALEVLTELPYKESLARKAELSVFIDQVPDRVFQGRDWCGGVGKSGLEALALGCAVIAGGQVVSTEPYIADPPVLWTDRERFERDLLALLAEPQRIRDLGERSRRWSATDGAPQATIDRILDRVGLGRHRAGGHLPTRSSSTSAIRP